ncbi:hypothetical protein LWM68_04540 [Niabella sp. W65]|nr:hypothetical protein [Niabella sp. W65]MCH7362100.1 hypothetical protein [Niabella sp. W65]ULT45854.1 hypothetical protein KRR40_23135 [Niabella sp. I65]
MQKIIQLQLSPQEASDHAFIQRQIAASEGIDPSGVTGFTILKALSMRARSNPGSI